MLLLAAGVPFLKGCRIGEASNPVPYTIGGATGSMDPRPPSAELLSLRRKDAEPRAGRDGECLTAAGKGEAVKASDLASKGLASFDDPDWAMEEEEHECDSQAAFPEPPFEEAQIVGRQAVLDGKEVRELFQALDVDVELSSRGKKLSAMAEWGLCPAVIEGIIDLPAVAEEEEGFHTAKGWWVSDPLAQER